MASALYKRGINHIKVVLDDMAKWMEEHEYESVQQLKGSVSQQHAIDPSAYERANYVQVLDNYSFPAGVLR